MKLPNKWAIAGSLALLTMSLAQAQSSAKSGTTAKDEFSAAKWEWDLFSGAQLFHKRPDPLQTKLLNSMEFGTRFTQNLWRYWSLEESLSGTTLADLTLLPVASAGNAPRIDLEQRVWKLGFNPVYHLTPIGSRVRPYLTLGYTQAFFDAVKDGKLTAAALKPVPASAFASTTKPAMNYGGGVKFRVSELVGFRFDIRGLWSGAPTWGLPPNIGNALPAGSLYIPKIGSLHGMNANAGIEFNFGGGTRMAAAEVKRRIFELSPIQGSPTTGVAGDMFTFRTNLTDSANARGIVYNWTIDGVAQPGATGPELKSTLTGGQHVMNVTATDPATRTTATAGPYTVNVGTAARTFELSALQANPGTNVYSGDPVTFSTKLTDSANAPNIVYTWTVDGVAQAGASGPEFRTTSLSAGSHQIGVTATDPATGKTATTGAYTMTVNPVPPLTITDGSDKSQLKPGETAKLTAQGTENAYSGPLTYTWKTNVGGIQGSGSSVTFVSSSVNFDPANVFKPESRTATITPTVTDARGRTATGNPIQITVNKDPQAMRLDDLIYGKGGSRVNNCAKRILIDELQGLMNNNPDVDVLLIGHIDKAEPTKGAKGRPLNLDHQRVYNAAAVLTAGTGVCAKCDLNRLKVSFAGTSQTSDYRSGFCGTSTRQKSDERKSEAIAADDEAAKNRRVEIWIVPKGLAMPGGATNVLPAPVKVIKAKGCPK